MANGSALPVKTDITDIESCQNLISKSINEFGQIDYLILNAGLSMWARFDQIKDISKFNELVNVNFNGSVNSIYSSLECLKESSGTIVTITTAQAFIGFPKATFYSASKHALKGFLEGLELETKGKIQFINVYLGWIKETNLRANAIGPNGEKIGDSHHKHSNKAVELDVCTDLIIKGIKQKKKNIFIPSYLKCIPFVKIFFNKWLFKKISTAVDSEELKNT